MRNNRNYYCFHQYAKFQFLTQQATQNTNIKITLFLNRIIEVATKDIGKKKNYIEIIPRNTPGGNVGIGRMKNNIRKLHSWPHMTQDIRKFVKNCGICEK